MELNAILWNGEGGGGVQRKSLHCTMSLSMTNAMDSTYTCNQVSECSTTHIAIAKRSSKYHFSHLLFFYWSFYNSSIY